MDYLTEKQVKELMKACKADRHSYRNATAILIAFRHGLRNSELCNLTWDNVNLDEGILEIIRRKNSRSGFHPMRGDEIRRLRKLKRTNNQSVYVFSNQNRNQLSTRSFTYIVQNAGKKIGLTLSPHILRHSCGFHLAAQGLDTRLIQDYLGHKKIENTVIYTKISPDRFKEIKWDN